MENNNARSYSFPAQVCILFAFDVLFLMVVGSICGDEAGRISTMFQFGSKGIAFSTLLQYFFNAVIIISLKYLFFSTRFLKNMMTLWRAIFLLSSVLAVSIGFILIFKWFPVNSLSAWINFLLWFGGSFAVCTVFMILKTKLDNKKYQELLSDYKNQHGGNNNE